METEGIVKLQMKNAAGETLGDEVQFAIGTGGGGQTGGTIVAIAFQSTPVYGSYGSTLRTFAAIRSVTSPLNWTSPHTLRLPVLGNSS